MSLENRSEVIPPYRIPPDPSDSQVHGGVSSLQFTPLIFCRVQVRRDGNCVISNSHNKTTLSHKKMLVYSVMYY